jgi:hypothetical protein
VAASLTTTAVGGKMAIMNPKRKPTQTKPPTLVSEYGRLWARNLKNIKELENRVGVYVLCDGSMPIYIGKGNLHSRIGHHHRSESKGEYWDHFSWFTIPDGRLRADVEALMIRMLPFYLRSLNKAKPKFADAKKGITQKDDRVGRPIKYRSLAPKRKHK